ncbi:hypothetical protein ASG72_16765 [Bosea sp. Leaf344]|uniref:BrnT family toxin n=1 Tax=Bosea sp. Leaf344 TaxID=1736346 RepID=UPI0006F6101A|nr:BrnT family toxin [Bosea sp. Leaf344]KQU50282.1 hypothetical protein ASG72_16765 [Bosea sp. Leaf344]
MGQNATCSWHDEKREIVFRSRGIDFADLEAFFCDSQAIVRLDDRRDYGEQRFNMLAREFGVVLNITFTPRAGRYHLISARIANRKEREIYAEAKR